MAWLGPRRCWSIAESMEQEHENDHEQEQASLPLTCMLHGSLSRQPRRRFRAQQFWVPPFRVPGRTVRPSGERS